MNKKNIMRVHEVKHETSSTLRYVYSVEGDWIKYFDMDNPMWVKYSESVEDVPDSMAVIPLVGNVIVLASLLDAEIYVNEIDRSFYESIDKFLEGFDEIMPEQVHFKLHDIVHAKKIVDAPSMQNKGQKDLLYYSGGVDSTYSLIAHLEERPCLVSIWGADIQCDDENSWQQAFDVSQKAAGQYHLALQTIRSNFRRVFNDDAVNDYSLSIVGDYWWSAFHHSVAMMCLAAPISQSGNLYFGSSYSSKDSRAWGRYVIASDPLIDNNVRFGNCQVIHDGYECSRYDKVKRICDHHDKDSKIIFLRVCYHSTTGKNCGVCEKCASAAMAILLAGKDPKEYGIPYESAKFPAYFAAGFQEMARSEKYACLSLYFDIQQEYQKQLQFDQVPLELRTFYESKLETLVDFLHVPNNEDIERSQVALRRQEELYRQIGQLTYELQCSQNRENALSKSEIGIWERLKTFLWRH